MVPSYGLLSNITVEAFAFHDPIDFAASVCLLKSLTFVVQLLPFAKRDHAFGQAPFSKIDAKRNQRQPSLFRSTYETQQLVLLQ